MSDASNLVQAEDAQVEGEAASSSADKIPFAFKFCKDIKRKDTSSWSVECNICGKQVLHRTPPCLHLSRGMWIHDGAPIAALLQFATTPHKMMYGHYLQKKGEHISKFCIDPSKLLKDHEDFVKQLEERWEVLANKRTLKVDDSKKNAKKQKAIMDVEESEEVCQRSMVESTGSGSGRKSVSGLSASGTASSGGVVPYAFLPAGDKQRLREEAQTAWDLAFVVCGITFASADHPQLRAAIEKTRSCPDFKLACAKTMRTTRLIKLDESANEYKDLRLKAGARFGFAITSDGWRSVAKRNYHNYILISVEGPIFIALQEVTGAGGTGTDIRDGFREHMEKLDADIKRNILIGITDTPSANRKAWRLLEAEYPKQFWVGCAAHEVSLLFKEWIKKIPDIFTLFKEGHRIVKWINNHSEILKLYRFCVPFHFQDKRKHSIGLYNPGDTRMATVFKMLYRLKVLQEVLVDLVSRPEYEIASQKALKQWSDARPAGDRLLAVEGKYPDKVKHSIQEKTFWARIEVFVQATKSAMYLLRLVDGQSPVLGKFYYCCALVDKHLRVLKEGGKTPYIDAMRSIFMKRWKRWHRPIHTFAYAVDPCYQEHDLTSEEKADCLKVSLVHVDLDSRVFSLASLTYSSASQVIQKLGGADWPLLKVEFDRWRTSGQSIFPKVVWDAADKYHGYQWWHSFGDDFKHLNVVACKVLAKPIAASACEFCWSDVSQVISKRTTQRSDANIERMVNVRAMHKLEKNVNMHVMLGNIPKLDDFLDALVNDEIDKTGGSGDDVPDAEEEDDADSSDDEAFDVVGEDVEELYELGGARNDDLESVVARHL